MYVEYPRWMYHRTAPARVVQNAQEQADLCPGWYTHPSLIPADEAPAEPIATVTAPQQPGGPVPSDPVPQAEGDALNDDPNKPAFTGEAAQHPTDEAAQVASEKAELWATPIAKILVKLVKAPKAVVEKVLAYEQENPKGARKGVVTAVEAALAKAE